MPPDIPWLLRQVSHGCLECLECNSISGLVVEYIVAIDVTRARFPADALLPLLICVYSHLIILAFTLAKSKFCAYKLESMLQPF